jgi:hypothetical protein
VVIVVIEMARHERFPERKRRFRKLRHPSQDLRIFRDSLHAFDRTQRDFGVSPKDFSLS